MLSLIPLVCWNPWILVKLTLLAQKLPLLVNLGYKVRRNHWRDVPRLHLCFKCQETYMEKFVACTIQFCKPPNRQLYSKHFLLWDGRRKRSAPTFSPPSSLMEIVITGNYRNTNKKALRSCKKKQKKDGETHVKFGSPLLWRPPRVTCHADVITKLVSPFDWSVYST